MTLFLHIGPPKTASTLGQILFAAADDSGTCVYLPEGRALRGGAGGGGGRVHHPVARAVQEPDTPEARALMAGVEEGLARGRTAGQSVLISSEMFPAEPALYLPLRDMAQRQGHDLRVLFVCRDPVARLNSMYTQNIRTGRFDGSIAEFVERALTTAPTAGMLRPCTHLRPGFAALGAGFDLLPYQAAGMGPLFRAFCAEIGLALPPAPPGPSPETRVNAGPSAAAIRLVREGVVAPDTPRLYEILQTADRTLAQPPYFGVTADLAQRIRTVLAGDLAALRASPMLLGHYRAETEAGLPPLNDAARVTGYDAYCRLVLDLVRGKAG
jgi:hypothetical protein